MVEEFLPKDLVDVVLMFCGEDLADAGDLVHVAVQHGHPHIVQWLQNRMEGCTKIAGGCTTSGSGGQKWSLTHCSVAAKSDGRMYNF